MGFVKNIFLIMYRQLFSNELRKELLSECRESNDPEKKQLEKYIKGFCRLRTFPYPFAKKYKYYKIKVFHDEDGDPYVLYKGSKMYMKRKWSDSYIREYFNSIVREQDEKSPHCYFHGDNERYPAMTDIVADVGAAEGVFALDIFRVGGCSKIYLFEADPEWVEPLKKTLMPWKDQCEIITKYIGKHVKDDTTTIDDFFKEKDITYLKADIEGMEEDLLVGAKESLENKIQKIFVCAYHLPYAETMVKRHLENYGFKICVNEGYMIYTKGEGNKSRVHPYLRRGVVYGFKEERDRKTVRS